MADPGRPFSGREAATWRGLLTTHANLTRALSRALEADYRLTISEFEVLIMLSPRDCCGLRMSALAEAVTLTPSGVSRLVGRLEERGLVERNRSDEADARSLVVSITEPGRELFAEASRTHRERVRKLFLSRLTAAESETLRQVFDRFATGPAVP